MFVDVSKHVCIAYPWWVGLQGTQVIFQSEAAAAVEQSLHTRHVGFHQLLPLACCLLLQSLHLLLEMLQQRENDHYYYYYLNVFNKSDDEYQHLFIEYLYLTR